jgi:hypothetical protein
MTSTQIQRHIARLQRQLLELGALHPGSISEQYNVCGTPGCQCKDPKKPRKHGPYYQLSFTWRGKSSTRFVRPESVAEMRQKVANYKRLRELVNQWVELAVELERAARAEAKQGRLAADGGGSARGAGHQGAPAPTVAAHGGAVAALALRAEARTGE